jgi:hypothetical protein
MASINYDGNSDNTHGAGSSPDDDSPARMAICVDVTRKTSMEAGFVIMQHMEEMEERRMRRERAADWAVVEADVKSRAADAKAKRRDGDKEAVKRAVRKQFGYDDGEEAEAEAAAALGRVKSQLKNLELETHMSPQLLPSGEGSSRTATKQEKNGLPAARNDGDGAHVEQPLNHSTYRSRWPVEAEERVTNVG